MDGDFTEAINQGVKEAYQEGYLRKSVVDDPVFERKNTKTNTPAIIYTDIVPGDKIKFLVMPKGFGSENMSTIAMLKPADGEKGIIDFVVETVKKAGPNPCPPTIIGVGIGGTIDKAMVIAKKAIVRKINQPNKNPKYAALEKEILTYYKFGGAHRLLAYPYSWYAGSSKCVLSCRPACRRNNIKKYKINGKRFYEKNYKDNYAFRCRKNC